MAFCHPFVHESSDLAHTLLLAGNFNLTNAHELFVEYSRHGSFPTSKADGYLITALIAKQLEEQSRNSPPSNHIAAALSSALTNADGAWTLCGMTADGWAFATRDPHGIRPGFYYVNEQVAVVASERPAIQAAFDVTPEEVKELPPGEALVVSPEGEIAFHPLFTFNSKLSTLNSPRPCSFERIYFSRANDADIHRERKALGAALVPQILEAAHAPLQDIFFSYIPNSARIAFHGLLEELFSMAVSGQQQLGGSAVKWLGGSTAQPLNHQTTEPHNHRTTQPHNHFPRFGEIAVKDAKFRTFIADAAARREFYKHVYDVTYGLVRPGLDTLVVLDDSIVRGNTMKNAILPMLDRLGPKRIVIASSAPPIRYPDCYGIDMSTLGELVAFRALVNLLDRERGTGNGERGTGNGEQELREALVGRVDPNAPRRLGDKPPYHNPLAPLYARFTEEEHCAEIARLLTPPDMKAEVAVVYQTTENLRRCLAPNHEPRTTNHESRTTNHEPRTTNHAVGDWYFTGEYPTPGGYKVLHTALQHYIEKSNERSY